MPKTNNLFDTDKLSQVRFDILFVAAAVVALALFFHPGKVLADCTTGSTCNGACTYASSGSGSAGYSCATLGIPTGYCENSMVEACVQTVCYSNDFMYTTNLATNEPCIGAASSVSTFEFCGQSYFISCGGSGPTPTPGTSVSCYTNLDCPVGGDGTAGDIGTCSSGTCSYSLACASNNWVSCSGEGGTCNFSGTAPVEFGANGTYNYGTYTNSVSCSNSVFGDPTPGVAKTCSYCAPLAAACGTGQGVYTSSAPANTNTSPYILCQSGTPSTVTLVGSNWTWTCQ